MADWYSELVSGPDDDDAGYYPDLTGDDESGYYPDLTGDDGDDAGAPSFLRGRARRRRRGGKSPSRGLALRGGGGTRLSDTAPLRERRLVLSGSAQVAPGGSQLIQIVPQVIFRAERMILVSTVPASMLLLDVKVGTRSQLVSASSQGTPFTVFAPGVQDALISFDTASVQSFFQVLVSNTGASSDTAFVTFIGTAAVE